MRRWAEEGAVRSMDNDERDEVGLAMPEARDDAIVDISVLLISERLSSLQVSPIDVLMNCNNLVIFGMTPSWKRKPQVTVITDLV